MSVTYAVLDHLKTRIISPYSYVRGYRVMTFAYVDFALCAYAALPDSPSSYAAFAHRAELEKSACALDSAAAAGMTVSVVCSSQAA